jgi:hypothetical protein
MRPRGPSRRRRDGGGGSSVPCQTGPSHRSDAPGLNRSSAHPKAWPNIDPPHRHGRRNFWPPVQSFGHHGPPPHCPRGSLFPRIGQPCRSRIRSSTAPRHPRSSGSTRLRVARSGRARSRTAEAINSPASRQRARCVRRMWRDLVTSLMAGPRRRGRRISRQLERRHSCAGLYVHLGYRAWAPEVARTLTTSPHRAPTSSTCQRALR